MEKEKDINHTEKTQEEMVKEAVEEAKKAASEAEAEKFRGSSGTGRSR